MLIWGPTGNCYLIAIEKEKVSTQNMPISLSLNDNYPPFWPFGWREKWREEKEEEEIEEKILFDWGGEGGVKREILCSQKFCNKS